MGRPVAFFEILSDNPERAQQFYADLFDWSVSPDPAMGGYALVDTRTESVPVSGGIGAPPAPGGTGVKIYVRVDDLGATLEKVRQLGGTTLQEPMELPGGYGTIAVFADPDGNPFGLWA